MDQVQNKKRHIEFAVVSTGDYVTTLRIVEQTHRNDNFSQQKQRNAFVSSLGFQLISDKYPKNTKIPAELYTALVRGTDAGMDDNTFEVETILLGYLWQAMTEYNDTDGVGYEKPWPQRNDVFYYVSATDKVVKALYWDDDPEHIDLQKVGNFFKTEEEAKAMADKFKVMLKGEE